MNTSAQGDGKELLLSVRHLNKNFGGVKALVDVGFDLHELSLIHI